MVLELEQLELHKITGSVLVVIQEEQVLALQKLSNLFGLITEK